MFLSGKLILTIIITAVEVWRYFTTDAEQQRLGILKTQLLLLLHVTGPEPVEAPPGRRGLTYAQGPHVT